MAYTVTTGAAFIGGGGKGQKMAQAKTMSITMRRGVTIAGTSYAAGEVCGDCPEKLAKYLISTTAAEATPEKKAEGKKAEKDEGKK